jgi:AraC-like DNA-binding protein
MKKVPPLPEGLLRDLIHRRGLRLIARHFGVSTGTVKRDLRRYNIHNPRESQNGLPRQFHISKEWLERMIAKYTLRQLAAISGITRNTLSLYCKRYGIENPRPKFIQPGEHAKALNDLANRSKRDKTSRL